tara:strand:+ start:336 stop:548 length:213 start_codon:yes stop_codon:yes gene_type:complete
MKAKDKARELVDRFKGVTRPFSKRRTLKVYIHPEHAKQCALICVDVILNSHIDSVYEAYYLEVKQEINKL